MSAQNQFENLMNQYSSEAAAEMEREQRAIKRRKLIKSITKVFFLLVLVAATALVYQNRGDINKSLAHLKLPSQAEMRAKHEAKAIEVQKLGQKRVDDFERTLK